MIAPDPEGTAKATRRRWRGKRILADLTEAAVRWCLHRYPDDPLQGFLMLFGRLAGIVDKAVVCPATRAKLNAVFERLTQEAGGAKSAAEKW